MSSPAIDPSLAFVYSAGLDGFIHKYAVGTGAEITGGGWPELSTRKIAVEKDGTAITIGTAADGTHYLYMGVGGYIGDAGDYQGHVTTINLQTGAQTVFNAMCSDQTAHFTSSNPNCAGQKSGIWAKAGLTFDPATNRVYAGTGNGTFDPSRRFWGDTILALDPDGTGRGGGPVDSYTPGNFQQLDDNDQDLGSTNVLILSNNGSKYPHLGLLSGKDAALRLVNLDDMSGQGGPGNVGGEISSVGLPTGGEVQNPISTWVNPADGATWAFVVSPTNGINGVRLSVDSNGNPSLVPVWQAGGGGGGAAVANNVLYYAANNDFRALDPTTGAQLWHSAAIGKIHWQTPTIANGVVYIADNSRQLTAFGLGSAQDAGAPDAGGETALPRTGWVATGSSSNGGDDPSKAIDGDINTRWSTGQAMADGMTFQVDMQFAQTFNQITMDSGPSANDFARGYEVYVSNDGTNFGSPIATGAGSAALVTVQFPTQSARYVKVAQTGSASWWWSIAELDVYTSGTTTPDAGGGPLPRTGWVATGSSSNGGDVPGSALDGNIGTRWSTGKAMANGMTFQVDMQSAQTFSKITMDSGGSASDYARGYQVFVSNDGTSFGPPIATGAGSAALIAVQFPMQSARYIKVVQTGSASWWWSIAELNVY
jgi:hypothetical protein